MLGYKDEYKYFTELRKILEANLEKISIELKYNFCTALLNYCSKKKFMDREKFIKTEFEIFRFMVENNILSIRSVKNIDGAFYKNVAYSALYAGETEWALEFIHKYKNLIAVENRENFYFHALIEYYIKLKNFDEVLNYLSRIKNTNVIDKLNIRKWEILVNYELKNYESLRYIIDSSKHFVKNDKMMSPEKKSSLTNFANYVLKLISISENNADSINLKISDLRNEITKSNTYYPEWLLEKMSGMEK